MPIPGMFKTKGEKFLQLIPSMMLLRLKYSSIQSDTAMADEVLLNEVMAADQTSAIYQAELQELASWNEQDIYEEVPNNGQPYMTVRWVVTQENV